LATGAPSRLDAESGVLRMIDQTARFDAQPNASNHFAWIRTILALQNTLMASVRTSVSLIGFGFTDAQFFEKLRSQVPEGMRRVGIDGPRNLGLVLIGAGVVSLAVFTFQYRRANHYLRSGDFAALATNSRSSLQQPTYFVAFAVLLIGVAAFVSIQARL
jgi:putative membrane protein